MIRLIVALVFCGMIGMASAAESWAPAPADKPVEVAVAVADPADSPAAAPSDELFASGGLTLREARKMGLTIGNVARIAKQLKKDGTIEAGMGSADAAIAVLSKLQEENPKDFAGDGFDLDAILAFIEKLLDLIAKIKTLWTF
jgi:hypothetical protein